MLFSFSFFLIRIIAFSTVLSFRIQPTEGGLKISCTSALHNLPHVYLSLHNGWTLREAVVLQYSLGANWTVSIKHIFLQ